MIDKRIKRCIRCGLPATYPGIKFDKKGECNYCAYYDLFADRETVIKQKLKQEFIRQIKIVKRGKHQYHGIIGLSGGKDSTYLLYLLKKKYGLNLLALTVDNGFISATAQQNIKKAVTALKVDLKTIKPKPADIKRIYVYALTHQIPYPSEILALLSPLCCVCHAMVFGLTLKQAIETKVPLLFIGYTPGQYPSVSLENFFKVKSCIYLSYMVYKDDPLDILKMLADPIREKFGKKVEKLYFKSQYIPKDLYIPQILFPFHALSDYDEEKIIRELSEKLGWEKPRDTDPFSTNCLLNSVGNYACQKQRRYHPYASEYSHMVRTGKTSRQEFIKSENICDNPLAMKFSLKKLGLKKAQLVQFKKTYARR